MPMASKDGRINLYNPFNCNMKEQLDTRIPRNLEAEDIGSFIDTLRCLTLEQLICLSGVDCLLC
jgi:hypothetical protein